MMNPAFAALMMGGKGNQLQKALNKMMAGKRGMESARRTLKDSKAIGAAAWTDLEMDVPLDIVSGVGIALRKAHFEGCDDLNESGDVTKIIISRNTVSAEKYIDEEDCIGKLSYASVDIGTAANQRVYSSILTKSWSPPVKYAANKIHVGCYSTKAITLRVELVFSLNFMDIMELLQSVMAVASY